MFSKFIKSDPAGDFSYLQQISKRHAKQSIVIPSEAKDLRTLLPAPQMPGLSSPVLRIPPCLCVSVVGFPSVQIRGKELLPPRRRRHVILAQPATDAPRRPQPVGERLPASRTRPLR